MRYTAITDSIQLTNVGTGYDSRHKVSMKSITTAEDYQNFEAYLEGQIEKVKIDNRDDKFLRTCLLTQYAYPAKNYIAASSENGRLKSLLSRLTFLK